MKFSSLSRKLLIEIAFLGPAIQFFFWTVGVLDTVTEWLKDGNHWIFSLALLIIYCVMRWWMLHFLYPEMESYRKRMKQNRLKHKKKLDRKNVRHERKEK